MATKKKPVAKKATKKPTAAKKTATKKPTAKKATNAKAKPKTTAAKLTTAVRAFPKPDTRRPDPAPLIPTGMVEALTEYFINVKLTLEEHAAHMRPLDRTRVNGVGIRRQGFIERAYQLALENTEFLPHWLTIQKFNDDHAHFVALRTLFDLNRQISELLWNLIMNSADMVYTDALEFYDSVRSAAKRRIDAAESVHSELAVFFERGRYKAEEPTEEEILRDMKGLLHGKKDGKIVIENVKPKLTADKHKVIDEHYADSAQFKETDEGSIKE